MRLLILGLALTFFTACQQPPKTKIYRKSSQDYGAFSKLLKKPVRVTDKTILLDARNAFDYGLSHAENSQHIQWDGYSQRNSKGLLNTNLNRISRRLALLGIKPDTPVVVLGNGPDGSGEEGRVAWMLLYLGIQDVQTSTIDALNLRRAKGEEPKPENAEKWEPKIYHRLLADPREVVGSAVGKKEKDIHVIDVRSPKEYFDKDKDSEDYKYPELRGLNIEWKEFFTNSGRPNAAMRKRLSNIGIGTKDRIVIISNEGLRSGAVTYALTVMGFQNVGNFAAGWNSLQ